MKPIIWAVSILAAGWSFPKLLAEDGARLGRTSALVV